MKTAFYHDIFNAVKALHYQYGKGEIIDGLMALGIGEITITAQCTNCKPHTIRATYDGKTLRMYRHQRKVTIV